MAPPRETAASLDAQTIFGPLVMSWTENVKVCAALPYATQGREHAAQVIQHCPSSCHDVSSVPQLMFGCIRSLIW